MLKHYYVNKDSSKNPNSNHEVHHEGCTNIPSISNRDYLGYFESCKEALKKASETYTNVDGCATCCPLCHKY